jgi:hypothetical protein
MRKVLASTAAAIPMIIGLQLLVAAPVHAQSNDLQCLADPKPRCLGVSCGSDGKWVCPAADPPAGDQCTAPKPRCLDVVCAADGQWFCPPADPPQNTVPEPASLALVAGAALAAALATRAARRRRR